MANMSHCRFENTYRDLKDCVYNMDNGSSYSEKHYMKKMRELCKEFIAEYDMMEEMNENDDDGEDNE
jgi:hypothetical protein